MSACLEVCIDEMVMALWAVLTLQIVGLKVSMCTIMLCHCFWKILCNEARAK